MRQSNVVQGGGYNNRTLSKKSTIKTQNKQKQGNFVGQFGYGCGLFLNSFKQKCPVFDYFGFHRGFLWQCSILIPTPLYHVALPHLKTILKSRTVAPKLFCIGLPLFEARYRKWSTRTCCRLAKRISRKKGRCRNGRKQTLQQPGGPVFEFWNQIFDHVHGSCAWATSTTQPDSTF